MKKWLLILSLTLCVALFPLGCGKSTEPAPAQPAEETEVPQPGQESLPTSETALKTEEKLELQTQAPPAPAVLTPDHWLNGTSDVEDMIPAVIAPEAPRKLIAEYGPAYLEQIGQTRVLHLKGSPFEMGYQHGKLMGEEIKLVIAKLNLIGGVAWSNDFSASIKEAWDRTSPFIPERYKKEVEAIAEGAGVPVEEIQKLNIFPELFHCSGFALWGKATADGELLHGRVLDYMRDAGLDEWAVLIIQEPQENNAFVNVSYAGIIGSVTGMNVEHVAVGEMGGKGDEKWDGLPMTFLLRECLELADTLEDARRIMSESDRTCQYYYVISDSKADNGRGSALGVAAEAEKDQITFIHPNEAHPLLARPVEDAVLMSAGDRYTCLVDRVEKMYGKFTPQVTLDLMARGVSMKSNMHNALFKPKTLELWVTNSTVESPACNLPYTYYDLNKLMSEKPTS